jgi:hypothetical protein
MDELLSPDLMEDPCEEIVVRTVPFSYNRRDIMRKSSFVPLPERAAQRIVNLKENSIGA